MRRLTDDELATKLHIARAMGSKAMGDVIESHIIERGMVKYLGQNLAVALGTDPDVLELLAETISADTVNGALGDGD